MNFEQQQITGRRRSMVEALASPSNTLEKHSNKRAKSHALGSTKSIRPFKSELEGVDSEDNTVSGSADASFLDFSQPSTKPPTAAKTPDKQENLSPFGASPLITKKMISPRAAPQARVNSAIKEVNHATLEEIEATLAQARGKGCIINDPIHGYITMDGLCLKIIDTKEFQRLRYLKQLGTCDYVYPGATHSRFSHSIGVSYYSELVLKNLLNNQPYLNITPIDILCVKVAGLCHDLGHGAYSHVWEVFMQRVSTEKWHHEDSSVQIFKLLLQRNDIKLSEYGLSEQDELFITEIIQGKKEAERRGRSRDKFFLYDIVNNSRSGLDVDKLDYFLRDIRHTNVNLNSVSFDRFFQLGRVLKAEPINGSTSNEHIYTICYPEKMVAEAVNLFAMRFNLHQKVYTHKSVKKVEYMLVDAFAKADPYIKIPGSVNEKHPDGLYRLSECVFDTVALSNLNDNIIYLIETSVAPELRPAQELLERVRCRKFYDCLGKAMYKRGSKLDIMKVPEIAERIVELSNIYLSELKEKFKETDSEGSFNRASSAGSSFNQSYGFVSSSFEHLDESYILSQDSFQPWVLRDLANQSSNGNQPSPKSSAYTEIHAIKAIELDDIIVEKMHIHYGLKSENPVNRLRFFSKDAEDIISSRWDDNIIGVQIKEQHYETQLPRVFEETAVRLFCRSKEKSVCVAEAFKRFSKAMNGADPFPLLSQSQY